MKSKRILGASLALALLAGQSTADWSIVAIDSATGEVAVAGASCWTDLNLKQKMPIIVVGMGAAAADGLVIEATIFGPMLIDLTQDSKVATFDKLALGQTPTQIVNSLKNFERNSEQQYAVAAFSGPPDHRTGSDMRNGKDAISGTVGTISYSIAGNFLAGASIVASMETTFLASSGDLGERILEAMQTGRDLGGDGRCSCSETNPTSCGVPPAGFTKSSHEAFMVVARIGDSDGNCGAKGCAQGSYYMNLNVKNQSASDDDAIDQLTSKYMTWRNRRSASPDAILSKVTAGAQSLVADGLTDTDVTIQLVDVDGLPLTTGGATVLVTSNTGLTTVGPVTDNGDGTYTFTATAGTIPGDETYLITAEDSIQKATLYPDFGLRVDFLVGMHVGFDELSAATGGVVPLTVNAVEGAGVAGASYCILASASGTFPGTTIGAVTVPLNSDAIFLYTMGAAGDPNILPGTTGVLDAAGRAEGAFKAPPPSVLSLIIGVRLDWATLYIDTVEHTTNADGFDVVP